jgi:Nucleoside 2-deoxyribosyltransferase like
VNSSSCTAIKIVSSLETHRTNGDERSVFLAGGMTHCPNWQSSAIDILAQKFAAPETISATAEVRRTLVVFNPRRIIPKISDFQLHATVEWEQRNLACSTAIVFWFPACDPSKTVQPIALYELGAAAATGRPIAVGAHPGYPRRADLLAQLDCVRPEITISSTLDDTINTALELLA